jgi:hypothetical protein
VSILIDTRIAHPVLASASHRFSVGDLVRLTSRIGVWPKTDEIYHVTATLPARDNLLQYRIRSDNERHERVATEDNLEPVRTAPSAESAVFASRTTQSAVKGPAIVSRGQIAGDRTSSMPKPGKAAVKPAPSAGGRTTTTAPSPSSRGKARK